MIMTVATLSLLKRVHGIMPVAALPLLKQIFGTTPVAAMPLMSRILGHRHCDQRLGVVRLHLDLDGLTGNGHTVCIGAVGLRLRRTDGMDGGTIPGSRDLGIGHPWKE